MNSNKFEIEDNILIHYHGNDSTVIIPDEITEIAYEAFYKNKTLQKVICGKNTEVIDWHSFYKCINLQEVQLSNKTKTIWMNAFEGCIKLNKINLTNKITTIGEDAFKGCISLAKNIIPAKFKNDIEKIGIKENKNITKITKKELNQMIKEEVRKQTKRKF